MNNLNDRLYNKLDSNSNQILQPTYLKTELMQHQKTSIYYMIELEKKGYIDINWRYYSNVPKDLRLETNIGILGDKVGAGKTLIVLTMLLENKLVEKRNFYYQSDRYITIKDINHSIDSYLNINLLLVPKGISHQWIDTMEKYIDKSCGFKYLDLTGNLNNIDQLNQINNQDNVPLTVICNETTFLKIKEKINGKICNRFIIDEADTIPLTTIDEISSYFIWLVTGTTNGISYSKKKYVKEIFDQNMTWLPEFITIKNKTEYVDFSIKLPVPNRIVIDCHTPIELKLVEEFIPKSIVNMINAGNIDDAIKNLNCNVDTPDNILKVISHNYEIAIKNKKIELKKELDIIYKSDAKKIEQEKKINKIENTIKRLNERIEAMKNRIDEMNDEICPVCMGELEKPTLVDCCAHFYCFECLTSILQLNNKCPHCQKNMNPTKIHILDEKNKKKYDKKKDVEKKKEKIDALLDIVNDNKKKYLVFADYEQTFTKIKSVLEKKKISYGILSGSTTKIVKTVKDFESGKINVIMLNAKSFGAGMNLQCATDIIMYHRFTKMMEEQIIGRAQRLGREGVLNVYYLIHSNENNSFDDDNYNDMNYEDYQDYLQNY